MCALFHLDVQGEVYVPNQIRHVLNNAHLDITCTGTGARPIGSSLSKLVEQVR